MEGIRIDATSNASIQFWAQQLMCTDAELKRAIDQVGNNLEAIREYLLAPPCTEPVTRPVWRKDVGGKDGASAAR